MNEDLAQLLTTQQLCQLNHLLTNFSQATGSVTVITSPGGQTISNVCGFSIFNTFSDDAVGEVAVPQNKTVDISEHYAISRLPLILDEQLMGFVCCGYLDVNQSAYSPFGPTGNSAGERAQASITLLHSVIQRELEGYQFQAGGAPVQVQMPVIRQAPALHTVPDKNNFHASLAKIDSISTTNKEISDALTFIEQHLNQNISLEEVAQRVYLSSFYFSKLFKKSTNMNFSDYLAAKKIKRAMVLLQDTNTPVNLIAHQLGFSQTSYFSKTFKRYVNETPSTFRKSFQ
ncbi:helix-turn-helix domain-containing protein [Furfurilactobacillus sp. WILCCON 0119]